MVRPESDISRLKGIQNIEVLTQPSDLWDLEISRMKPDAIILADWAGVAGKYSDSAQQNSNTDRWVKLAKSAKLSSVKKIIAFGSQAEVGKLLENVLENSPCSPVTEYGRAKHAALHALSKELEGSDSQLIWARIFTVYGPGDNDHWLIPSAIKSLKKEEVFKTTQGAQLWNYLYISDLCEAVSTLLENSTTSGIFNVAHPESISIRSLLTTLGLQMGKLNLINFGALPYAEDQIMRVVPDVSKLLDLGWYPKVDLPTGLLSTIESFNLNHIN
jgi:nucleoside-diphosphate-sugar epimerase